MSEAIQPREGLTSPTPPTSSNVPAPSWATKPASYANARLSSVGHLILAGALDLVLAIVTLGIGWLVWSLIAAGNAQTPAKQLMGMRVVDAETGVPLSFGSYVFMRGLVGGTVQSFVSMVTFGVLALMPLWDSRNQSIAAKVSNSVVVKA